MISLDYTHRYNGVHISSIDIVKDAFLNGIVATGLVTYEYLKHAHVSIIPYCVLKNGILMLKKIRLSSVDLQISSAISKMNILNVYNKVNNEIFTLHNWKSSFSHIPYCGNGISKCISITPMLIGYHGRDHDRYSRLDKSEFVGSENKNQINEIVSYNLTNALKRDIKIEIIPDYEYFKRTNKIVVNQPFKTRKDGTAIFISGVKFPFSIIGDPKDILSAWYCGVGKKTRYGFGCFDIIGEQV